MSNKNIKENMKKQLNDDIYLTKIAKNAFDFADKNKNGIIDMTEFKRCLIEIAQGLGAPLPEDSQARDEFFHFDKDKNNVIDFDEFKLFVKKYMILLIDKLPDN